MADTKLTAVVADDEQLARDYLVRQLKSQSVEVVGEARNASEALQIMGNAGPDLLFLDIKMPGMSGIEFASMLLQTDTDTLVVFVTAYAEFAVDAFQHGALDYLVKPIAVERLATTLTRARERIKGPGLVEPSPPGFVFDERNPRLPVRGSFGIRLLPVSEILYATARDKKVFVNTINGEFRVTYALAELEALLPQRRYFRIHDAWLVNLDSIEELCFLGNHSYLVRLSNGQQLPVSRYRCAELQRRLGIVDRRNASSDP